MLLPEPIRRLIDAFSRLPGVGPKTASRLAFYLLRSGDDLTQELAAQTEEISSLNQRAIGVREPTAWDRLTIMS